MALASEAKSRIVPGDLAVADERHTYSWGELNDVLNRAINAIQGFKFGPERRVSVFAYNSAETVLAYLSCLHAGVSAVPVNSHLKLDELIYILQDSATEVMFVGPETCELGLEAARQVGGVTVIGWRCEAHEGLIVWETWLAQSQGAEPATDLRPRPYLQYTSGTTGRPKAIDAVATTLPPAETILEFFDLLKQWNDGRPVGPHLVVGPLYHNAPLSSVRGLASGRPIVVMSRFDPEKALGLIQRHGVETSVMVPTHFKRFLSLPTETRERYDISTLQQVVHTGAACPRDVKAAIIDWFGPILLEAYGGTESGTTNLITAEEWLKHPGSVGKTLDTFELQIFDDEGVQLGPNSPGQIFFRDKSGRGITYRNDPAKTAAAHRAPGVFTLGDVGYVDDEGYLYITDRVSDMIVSGGVNIYPAEIEQVLLTHPEVSDAVVIGVPNVDLGEEPKALVIPRDMSNPPKALELQAYCRSNIAAYKCPRSIDFVEDVGRNLLGKVNKRQLRSPFWPTERTIG